MTVFASMKSQTVGCCQDRPCHVSSSPGTAGGRLRATGLGVTWGHRADGGSGRQCPPGGGNHGVHSGRGLWPGAPVAASSSRLPSNGPRASACTAAVHLVSCQACPTNDFSTNSSGRRCLLASPSCPSSDAGSTWSQALSSCV